MMPVVDLSGHCKATEESGSFYTRGVLWVGHVTDKSLGHVTDKSLGHVTDNSLGHVTDESLGHVTEGVEKKLYLLLYRSDISGSCDHLPLYPWVM
jgi:hypothetical protein